MLLDQTIDLAFTSIIFSNPLVNNEKIYSEEIVCVGHPDLVNHYLKDNRIINDPVPVIMNSLHTPRGA
ncbi:hypothetical protein [Ferviditalea candida]|uniref:Uncharacterized protein n=1 Tax=Ferviditalea candida TaxID=3108399 RepID=A0ABU5ZJF2_9BACL|nr:hypothetical protein [Paenibacillaceae bacterium T2]